MWAVAAITTVLAASLSVTGVASGQAGGSCTSPYQPVASERVYPDGSEQAPGSTVAVDQLASSTQLNESGTARVDTTQPVGPTLVVIRPSGDLQLTLGGATLVGSSAGDLDGDGEDEVWVTELSGGVGTSPTLVAGYVVWSSTPAGAHDVATVGTRGPVGVSFGATGWDGDAVPDVVVVSGTDPSLRTGSTVVVSGADLLAAGPGGDASSGSELVSADGVAGAVARFGAGPELITASVDPGGQGQTVWSSDGTRVLAFTTLPDEYQSSSRQVGLVAAFERGAVRYVAITNSNRGGAVSWTWSLDEPCVQIGPRASGSTTTTTLAAPGAGTASASRAGGTGLRFTG